MTKAQDKTDIAVMRNQLENLIKIVDKIDVRLESDYITRQEFDPIKKVVYGVVSLILVAVVGALVALVIRK